MDSPILILLAGGKSTRMGTPKGLLDYQGIPWVLAQISRYKHVKNPIVHIGLGYDFKRYLTLIPWFQKAIDAPYNHNGVEVKVIINDQPQYGAFSTLQKVLKSIDKKYSVLVLPIDVPLLKKQYLTSIIREDNTIAIPVCNDNNGHPVKLKPEFWSTLLTVDTSLDEARLDRQIKRYKNSSIAYVNVLDSSVYQNINTRLEWDNYTKINSKQ